MLASLTALWAFAAWVTLRDGLNLLWVNTLNSTVYVPSEPLLTALQTERRLSLAYLGAPKSDARTKLDDQRRKTERLAVEFTKSAQGWQTGVAGDAKLDQRLNETYAALDALADTRGSVDRQAIGRAAAATAFTNAVDSIFRIYDATASLDDQEVAADARALIQLNRMAEVISQEDAWLSGVLADGRTTAADYLQFVNLVAAQRFLGAETSTKLSADDRARYDQMIEGGAFSRLRSLEDAMVQNGRSTSKVPVETAKWRDAVDSALIEVHSAITAGGDGIVERATSVAIGVFVRLILAAGLGAVAVAASVILSIRTARALVAQLQRLRNAAHDLADDRLPGIVARLGRGEAVDVAAEAPPLDFGDDEIGQVGQAFNRVQETAIRTAVEQAELRRSVRDVFLSLARRTQALVHRQVTLLDQMERAEENPDTLEGLYRVDHLATRMRRNAENLIVLSGATPGRAWRRNVPMVDVVRGAMAEVEDYQRVTVLPFSPVGLAGRAVGDLIHLLAELIENALSFSPPNTGVEIKGQMVANGYVIEIEDRGLGMPAEDLAAANVQITTAQEFSLSNATRLGLYVVSRLTERHGVRVQLKESPYGGTTAVVLVPIDLVTDSAPAVEAADGALPMTRAAAAIGGATRADENRPSDGPPPQARGSIAVVDPPAPPSGGAAATSSGAPPALPRRADRYRKGSDFPSASTDLPTTSIVSEPDFTVNSDQPPAPTIEPETSHTPSGLPFRVRQASLAPPLRDQGQDVSEAAAEDDIPRPPDQVRKMMSSYQSGTRRGRSDAARLIDEEGDPSTSGAEDPPAHGHPLT